MYYDDNSNIFNNNNILNQYDFDFTKDNLTDYIHSFSILNDNESIPTTPKKIFKVIRKKNRGVQKLDRDFSLLNPSSANLYKNIHSNYSYDNIFRKLQIHYFNFIVNVTNDVIGSVLLDNNKLSFGKIAYKLKKNINLEMIDRLRKSNIEYILKLKESKKYKQIHKKNSIENMNDYTLQKISQSSKWMSEYFKINYLKFFKYYYNKLEPLKEIINIEGKIILIRKKTKSLYDLLIKNRDIKDKLIEIVESFYLSRPKFISKGDY